MSPRRPEPEIAERLVAVAARLLATDGPAGVSARRVAAEAGASTMAVYTHHGSMEELLAAVRRTGFQRFATELTSIATTDDPVADVMAQGWAYRHFAITEPHLYQAMFQQRWDDVASTDEDRAAALGTFLSLVERIERCASVGPWFVGDAAEAAEVVWATVHGHCSIELSGAHTASGRDPASTYGRCLLHLAIGFGQAPGDAAAALAASRQRAEESGRLDP